MARNILNHCPQGVKQYSARVTSVSLPTRIAKKPGESSPNTNHHPNSVLPPVLAFALGLFNTLVFISPSAQAICPQATQGATLSPSIFFFSARTCASRSVICDFNTSLAPLSVVMLTGVSVCKNAPSLRTRWPHPRIHLTGKYIYFA
jgi:hypothetical protein